MGRQPFHRFHELRAFGPHDEADGIPMRAAAEAVEVVVINIERRRLFPMKGAAALPVPPGFEQPRLPPDQTGQRRASAKLIKETGGQGHGEGVGYTFDGKSGARVESVKKFPINYEAFLELGSWLFLKPFGVFFPNAFRYQGTILDPMILTLMLGCPTLNLSVTCALSKEKASSEDVPLRR
jgi:hypothetical protein